MVYKISYFLIRKYVKTKVFPKFVVSRSKLIRKLQICGVWIDLQKKVFSCAYLLIPLGKEASNRIYVKTNSINQYIHNSQQQFYIEDVFVTLNHCFRQAAPNLFGRCPKCTTVQNNCGRPKYPKLFNIGKWDKILQAPVNFANRYIISH